LFRISVATPATEIVVFFAGLAASVIVGRPDTWTAPPLMAAVPDTAPVVVLNVHEDVTDVAPRLPVVLSVALTFDTVDDALVGPAVSMTVPVVSRPVMLAFDTVTGDVPG